MEKQGYHECLTELKSAFPGVSVITRKEAARYLRIDPRTLAQDKTFPVKRLGGRNYVYLASLARWLA